MTSDHALILRAADFAAYRHRDQRRKGADREPYINHLIEVAALLAGGAHGDDAILIAGGFLHDTIEDTDTTAAELSAAFGPVVAALVLEVSDDKDLEVDARKRLQVDRVAAKSYRAKLLTIADKTSNLRSTVRSPPVGWSRSRIREYARWAQAVVEQVHGLDAALDDAFAQALGDVRARHGAG